MIGNPTNDKEIDLNLISNFSSSFTDMKFKPEITSLIDFEDEKLSAQEKLAWSSYDWISLRSFDNTFLLNNPSSSDVIRGSNRNCDFLSVCAAIAEFPHRLEKIFLIKTANLTGIYAINFFIDGKMEKIVVDDLIPYNFKTDKIPFARFNNKSRNIWVTMLEKAWAKFLGNYQKMIFGRPNDIFTVLTGAPSEHFFTNNIIEVKKEEDKEIVWKKINDYYLNGYILCCRTKNQHFTDDNKEIDISETLALNDHITLIEELNDIGLIMDNVYSIILAHEEIIEDEKVRILKIRNLCGLINQKKLKFNSILTISQKYMYLINQLGLNNKDEEIMIMTFDEFKKYFCDVYVCKYIDNYIVRSNYYKINLNSHFTLFDLKIKNKISTKSFISIVKPTKMLFNGKNEEINIYMSIWFSSLVDNKQRYISHVEGNPSSLTLEIDVLEEGDYIILVHSDLPDIDVSNYEPTIQMYFHQESDKKLSFIENHNSDPFTIFESICASYYKSYANNNSGKKFLTDDQLIYSDSINFQSSNYSFMIFENNKINEKILIDLEVKIKSVLGWESILKTIKSPHYEGVQLNYGERMIVPFYNASFTSTFNFKTFTFLSHDYLKIETRKNGEIKSIPIGNQEIYYYFLKHGTGIVFLFSNVNLPSLISVKLKITEMCNLQCQEEKNQLNIEIYLEPDCEIFRFYEIIDISQGFQLKWLVSAELLI